MNKDLALHLLIAMTLLVACVVFTPLTSYAQLTGTNHDNVASVAHNWLQYNRTLDPNSGPSTLDAAPVIQEIFYQGQLVGYVASETNGYVIVPAFNELPPVMAYSTESGFNVNDDGGFVELIKEELASKIQLAQSVLTTANPSPEMQPVREQIENDRSDWQTYSASYDEFRRSMISRRASNPLDDVQDVGPMVTTAWHQGLPFANFCPMGTNGRCLVGCVATAMAQIVAFWHQPDCGSGTHSYNWAGDHSCAGTPSPPATLTATYSDGYDWANMPNVVSMSSPQAQQDAVAELSYEVGVSVNMMYGHCASGAYVPGPVTTAFQTNFGMASGMDIQHRNSYTAASWFTMLQQDLNAGHPGFYTIASHAIVLDGYRVSGGLNQIHMNYGWYDTHTAWYTVDALYCTWSGCNPLVEQVIRYIHPTSGSTPSSITVSAPNGGESYVSSSTQTVTWSSSNLSEAVKLELNRSYPSPTWETIIASTANTGSYSWSVSGAATSTARIRITGTAQTTVGDTSNANFSITAAPPPATLTVTAPNGGESWAVSTAHTVTWTSANLSEAIKIEVNRTYPSSTWETIASGLDNSGSYSWAVSGTATITARIRITGTVHTAVGDTSAANFTITLTPPPPSILTLTSPNGSESWTVGTAHAITWTSANFTDNVAIELNRAYPVGTWETLVPAAANTGSYSWTIAGAASSLARIRIHGVSNVAVGDTSNANFSLAASGGGPATVTVVAPNGGESLHPNVWLNVRWNSTGSSPTASVRIQINRSYPIGAWETISLATPNDGSYQWPVTGSATNQARIRISLVSDPATSDISNSNFSITGTFLTDNPLPAGTGLLSASPNPFNPSTQIRFNLVEATRVTLEVYDIAGRKVATLMDTEAEAGAHSVTMDGTNLPSGIYFVRMTAGSLRTIQKIQLLK